MTSSDDNAVQRAVARRAQRLARMRDRRATSPLLGLSAFGVIGWSIAVLSVGGALAGWWLNQHYPQPFSWVLALMLAGLVLGVIHAWNWVARTQTVVEREDADD